MEGKLQDYLQRILGITDLQAGAVQVASRVPATAAAAVEGASTLRSMDKQVNVERSAREIGTRMLGLCQQFLDDGRAVRIAGPDAPLWLDVSAEDIDGEFSIETEGGSTQAVNPLTKARQGMEILTQIAPMLAQFGYDPENAIRSALSYMGLNPDHLLVKPEPAPAPEAAGMPAGEVVPGEAPADMNNPALAGLLEMGGPPIPGAAEGDML
jgi:hypothetical protein